MDLTSTAAGSARIVKVHAARIDAAMAVQFKEDMRQMIEGGPDHVILDLSEVEFIDSSGLGAIVASMKLMKGGRLDLAGLTPMVDKVFRLTRMDTVFKLFNSIDDACAAL